MHYLLSWRKLAVGSVWFAYKLRVFVSLTRRVRPGFVSYKAESPVWVGL